MIRTFIAIDIPPEIREAVAEFQQKVAKEGLHIRWVRPENIHITIKFLGEIPESLVNQIKTDIFESLPLCEPFDVSFGGTGVFPNHKRPRIFWVGIMDGYEELVQLAKTLDERLSLLSIEKEKRTFRPHVTLGRFSKQPVRVDLKIHISPETLNTGRFPVDKFLLMKSVLHSSGPEYSVLAEHPLTT